MDDKELIKELLQSLDFIKQAVDNLYEMNYECITEIRGHLQCLNLIITKNVKE